jgi:Flp pilus assembly pilin Flp
MFSSKGSSLIQYAIILGVIIIIIVPAFYLIGNNVVNFFSAFKESVATNSMSSETNETIPASNPTNETLPSPEPPISTANYDTPVVTCSGNMCTMDFGPLILEGIPDDYGLFIETAGVAGGTEKTAALINQIATQLEAQGLVDESNMVQKLATIGHNMALVEKEMEKFGESCNFDKTCMLNKLTEPMPKPAGFDETYYSFSPSTYGDIPVEVAVGFAQSGNNDDPNTSSKMFANTFNEIMAQPDLSQQQKNIIKELYWEIGMIGEHVEASISYLDDNSPHRHCYDPVTGDTFLDYSLPESTQTLLDQYSPSSLMHLDSAVICAAGSGEDTGTSCHKVN